MNIIGYQRVSTKRQGESGLGLEGQQTALNAYATMTAQPIIKTYCEIESGKRSDRPELAKALAHARRSKAVLVVAKLDRLSRDVEFLAHVMNSDVEFVACDNATANRLTLHILSAVAEAEAIAISDRTKAALKAYKARGGVLGSARPGHWAGREHLRTAGLAKGRKAATITIRLNAREAYADLAPMMVAARERGDTLATIAATLNEEGHTTRTGKPWNPVQVMRVLDRL